MEETVELPVRFHTLLLPNVTLTVPIDDETLDEFLWDVMLPLVIPVHAEDPVSFRVAVESLPTRTFPLIIWSVASTEALLERPLHASSQTDRNTFSESLLLIVTSFSVIAAVS